MDDGGVDDGAVEESKEDLTLNLVSNDGVEESKEDLTLDLDKGLLVRSQTLFQMVPFAQMVPRKVGLYTNMINTCHNK